MPPPKQKPTAPSFTSGVRLRSSSMPDCRSPTCSPIDGFISAAVASAGSENLAVPPSRETRSTHSAL